MLDQFIDKGHNYLHTIFSYFMTIKHPFLPFQIHSSWKAFFTEEIQYILKEIYKALDIEEETTPPVNLMLRFFELDLYSMKAVVLGQDPYPQKGVATGRAFEVKPLQSWHDSFRNTSLRNIVRALYSMDEENETLTFTQIKKEILEQRFQILHPDELFKHWEKQGVLLLNTSFSCKIGKPGSHSAIWLPFTQRLLSYINKQQPELYWLLWGAHARKMVSHLSLKNVLKSHHPMICSDRAEDFLFGKINHFRELRKTIDWGVSNIKST